MGRQHDYAISLTWSGAATGPTESYEGYSREYRASVPGKPPMTGTADPAFRGDPKLYNPEELLVIALSSCHMLSYLAVCVHAGIAVVAYEDAASGTMIEERGGGRFTEVVLRPRVVIAGGDRERAVTLHDKAHRICFIANSVNFPVRNEPQVTVQGAASA